MYLAKKIRLYPTKEQEILFRKFAGVARWAYNYYINKNHNAYKLYLEAHKDVSIKHYYSALDVEI